MPQSPPPAPPPATGLLASAPRIVAGLGEIAGPYDGFIVDLWGVIHDGFAPYAGAIRCLEELRARGKRTVLLSNAPRRREVLIRRLEALGIARPLYGDVVSAGEEVHLALASRSDPWFAALGRRCFHLGPARDASVWEGAGLDMVRALADATFILNTGPWDDEAHVGQYEELLAEAARRRLPMVCANPDRDVVHRGRIVLCAGGLALRYEELGGAVRYIGKPHAQVYRRCFEVLGISEPRRILAIGDSLITDVAGAAALGMDTVFVTGGLHAAGLGLAPEAPPDPVRLARVYAETGIAPVAAMALFAW
jgi:HAD superfamily hydrolase (TIGR01459 family)